MDKLHYMGMRSKAIQLGTMASLALCRNWAVCLRLKAGWKQRAGYATQTQ